MDASGNFYVAGYTISTDFPLTPGAFYSPGTDSQGLNDFVAKLDASLSTLDFSLLFGGNYHPIPDAVAVDSSDFTLPLLPPPTGPLITSIVNAASLSQPDYISPGEIVSILGLSIGPTQPVSYQLDSSGDVPSNLNGLQVLINGVAAPILYASENQINAVVPFSVMDTGANLDTATFEVQNPALSADLTASTLWIVSSVPGIFESGGTGLILNQDATQNSPANPAKQGSIVSLFVTGVGPMTPASMDGSFARGTTSTPTLPIQVFLGIGSGSLYAPVNHDSITYVGDAPGEIEGLQQINVQLPTGTVYGSLYVTAGSGVSNAVAFFEQ